MGWSCNGRGILYTPDYIINASGVINASCEIGSAYNEDRAREKTSRIYETTEKVLSIAHREEICPSQAADRLSEDRIKSINGLRRVFRRG